jgi:2,3-dihydroxybenzoate---[aryl-carrier protein] ligase
MLEGCVPWPEAMLRRYREADALRDETLGELLDEAARRFPERIAIIQGETRLSYATLHQLTERAADHLVALGFRPFERVVVQMPNLPEFVILYFAMLKIGVLPIMAVPAHRAAEIDYFIGHADAAGYVIASRYRNFDYLALAHEQRQRHPSLRNVLVVGEGCPDSPGFVSIPKLLEREAPRRPDFRPDPFDVALFQLSGGTTGLPKLIPRTHSDYCYNSRLVAEIFEYDRSTVVMVAIPVSHNFPIQWGIQAPFMVGATAVLIKDPNPGEILAAIERERVSVLPAVPAQHVAIMDRLENEQREVASLKHVIAGGSKFVSAAAQRAIDKYQCTVQQVLGMAEGFCSVTRLADSLPTVLETVGRPLSELDEFRLVDPEGIEVARGEVGELVVRGPYTIRGYYRAPEHNVRSFTADGFYRTGDVLRLDDTGNLVVEGRNKDIINRAGEKFSAEEVENLLADHPKIQSAVLVAMPDRVMGEKGCLFAVPRPGQVPTLAEVVAHMEGKRVARFKCPERLEIVEQFPLTAVGKISRRELREIIARKLEQEN